MRAEVTVRERVEAATTRWHLSVGDQLTGGTRSAVYGARDDGGRDLVLKLVQARPDAADVTAAEAAALTAWAGTDAAATLVDATADALLLARAVPGTVLPWQPAEPLSEVIDVAAGLLRALWSAPPGAHRFASLGEVYPDEERVARKDAAYEQRRQGDPDRGRPGLLLLPAAARTAEWLISTGPATVQLHGDFITKNVLRDEASSIGYVAIDPSPRTGDPAADVGAFAAYQPAGLILPIAEGGLILPIAEGLARSAGVDLQRALRWAAIYTVHQAAQAWRDDQLVLEGLVASSTIRRLLR